MAIGKWIGGFLGFVGGGGPLGALVGFFFGAIFDKMLDAVNTPDSQPKETLTVLSVKTRATPSPNSEDAKRKETAILSSSPCLCSLLTSLMPMAR